MDARQLRDLVIRPTLDHLKLGSIEAEHLLLMTAAHETQMGRYLKQIRGPALGIYQMEPDTHQDIWDNFLRYRETLHWRAEELEPMFQSGSADQMVGNLYYATAMARVHYLRDPNPIPKMEDCDNMYDYVDQLGAYAKRVFNTHLGKATINDYVKSFIRYCNDIVREDWEGQ